MRRLPLSAFCLALSTVAMAQLSSATDRPIALKRDSQAEALVARVLAANGPRISAETGTTTSGTIRLGEDPTRYPVKIYTMGNDHIRTEIDRPEGTHTRIVNSGRASYTPGTGQNRNLNLLNTINERIEHIPSLSAIADDDTDHQQLEYLGENDVGGARIQKVAASWSDAVTPDEQQEFLNRTRIVYFIETETNRIVQVEYDRCAEEDSNVIFHYRVVYSDYTESGGRSIPATVTTYLNGAFLSELKIASYAENTGASPATFTLPEVTR